ncbi:hypothetical protein B0J11DRAFT_335790 [Dendryphion nanum]|uniref:ER-bound oxygenase mpaB/mpaB'/Rubber oxygenase catalytic domain-containing protein n=1 Tax=Dendryphion nanum TaxID=256645 RepID=A0A9P9DND1_9PLEO|nr:hypothetical protein B0J11DRAFT_335790 [Dendryphion nanum]
MAWPNPFRRRTESYRNCWGYGFDWTDDHLTHEISERLKHSYDVLAEECLDRLNTISPPDKGVLPRSNSQKPSQVTGIDSEKKEGLPLPQRDLFALLRDHHESDPKLSELWTEVNTIPDWVDWDQIQRGQDVFYRYGGPALTGLCYNSLLGGMGAARVVETLARTGGFSTKMARRRLFETTQHILQCTYSLESLQPGGAGHASSVRVRLLHAAVRQRIMKLAGQRPSYFNVEEWGIPVNDLDQMATIGTFCAALIWVSFPRQGIFLREQEKADYVALWRYIGYLLGTPNEWFETPAKAKAVMESLLYSEVHPSDMSKTLANNIIHALEKQPPTYVSPDMLIASARWLNGNELGDSLGLPRVSLYYWALMAGQCLFFISFCYIYRAIPYLDRRNIARVKRIFYAVIVDSKWGLAGTETLFDFKYVPEYETVTDMGKMSEIKLRQSPVEMRNLRTLGIFLGVVGVGTWVAVKAAGAVARMVW